MKKILIILCTLFLLFILVFGIKKIGGDIKESNKEKVCVNSGGKWDYMVVGWDVPVYYCNCEFESNYNDNGNYFIRNTSYKLENKKDDKVFSCSSCQNDSDCGRNACNSDDFRCTQEKYQCVKGQCESIEERFDNPGDGNIYNCQDLKCVKTNYPTYLNSVN